MKLNIPAGLKIYGANLIPKAANVAVDSGLQAWSQMILTWDWSGWVKPQIDYLVGNNIGVNCIRLIGANWGVLAGRYTQAAYDAKILQVANYLNSLGVYFYASCGDNSRDTIQWGSASSNAAVADCFATTLLQVQAIGNCIGVDVIQECSSGAYGMAQAGYMVQLLKARGATLPMTCSVSETITAASGGTDANLGAPGFDFIDVHLYPGTTPTVAMNQLDYFRTTWPDKDVLIGEWGTSQGSDGAVEQSWGIPVLNLANSADPGIRGSLVWACSDQDTVNGNRFGVFDDTFAIRQSKANLLRRYTGGSLAKSLALHR